MDRWSPRRRTGSTPNAATGGTAAPELEDERFYEPTDHGFEAELGKRLAELRKRFEKGS